ncbi:DUF2165 family protein [Hyphococcus sp.]|uniref:DUF2165 family protein n=1 Tax=Hyphococcus sp. TaxID=2038636 RepID=UPI00208294E7|nr:MAG: hypothetical protein DHS20C04_20090 [Marinicaulis sp.]
MLRMLKILLVLSVAAWGLIGGFMNILHWPETTGSVAAVTSMATFEGGPESWRATSNPIVILLGALFITISKLTGGLLCAIGAMKMFGARNGGAAAFGHAKQTALAGCAVIIFMLFGGFIVIAEGWFDLWRSDVMRAPALGSAFRYCAIIALFALFVAGSEDGAERS